MAGFLGVPILMILGDRKWGRGLPSKYKRGTYVTGANNAYENMIQL